MKLWISFVFSTCVFIETSSAKLITTYPVCDETNSYYEADIANALLPLQYHSIKSKTETCEFEGVEKPNPLRSPKETDMLCILNVQKVKTGGAGFSYCTSETSPTYYKGEKYNLKRNAPCSSREYVELMTRSLNLVSACVDLSPRDLFALYSQESSMHLNVISGTGAGGIGQLTTDAIAGVQMYEAIKTRPEVVSRVKEIDRRIKNDPNCALLQEHHQRNLTQDQIGRPCQYLSFPRNPLYPLLIGAKHYAYYHAIIEAKLKNTPAIMQKFSKPDSLEYITRELTYYSYNSGQSPIMAQFKAFMDTLDADEVPGEQSALLKRFRDYLAKNFPQEKRREEVSGHVRTDGEGRGILNRRNELEEAMKSTCFQ